MNVELINGNDRVGEMVCDAMRSVLKSPTHPTHIRPVRINMKDSRLKVVDTTSGNQVTNASGSKDLTGIPKRFELQRIPAGVKKKHRGLLARLTFKSNVGFDDKFDTVSA